ncbi:hypothetical protein [Wenzhouxiangella limi]|uniref:Uncharacterized protein n=1 Tax=Wenzhouxiangella limi TaxID=2707351 RepID=A0A845V5T4_9GAMM|nr:hypothetical protein [Wenzhouxiangella limi]NDY96536.1 hypothetical protein [Wenzhouxiangella limi]
MNRCLGPLMIFGLSLPVAAAAVDESQEEEPRIADREERQERLMEMHCRDDLDRPQSWLDRSHAYMSRRLCEPAAWFDGFFGDPRALEETPVGTFIRLRNALEWDQSDGWSLGVRVRANIEVPRVSDRVRLLVSRDDDLSGELSDGPEADDGDDRTRLGLRFIASQRERSQLDLDGTVRVTSGGLNPRLRGRYRNVRALSANTLVRATQTVFWERDDGLGTTSRLDWEWLPNRNRLLRWSGRGTFSEASDGVDWRTSVTDFRQLDLRTAIRTEVGAFGYTQPQFDSEEYFFAVRFRRQFARPWLFYEIQPEHAWPLDPVSGQRGSDWRLTFTLEIQFENQRSRERRLHDYWGEDAGELKLEPLDEPIPVEAPGESGVPEVIEDPDDPDD